METDVVISALTRKRDEIDADLRQAEQRIVALRADRATIEAAIKLFDPARSTAAARPPAKAPERPGHFRLGELAKRCRDALREANGQPVTTQDVIDALLAAKGLDLSDAAVRRDFGQRVLGAFYRMAQNGELRRTGEGLQASWQVV